MEPKTYATVQELAKILNVAPSWVYEQTRKDKIPRLRCGKHIRFDVATVLQSYKVEKPEKAVASEEGDPVDMSDLLDIMWYRTVQSPSLWITGRMFHERKHSQAHVKR